jgi:hypothetical protein
MLADAGVAPGTVRVENGSGLFDATSVPASVVAKVLAAGVARLPGRPRAGRRPGDRRRRRHAAAPLRPGRRCAAGCAARPAPWPRCRAWPGYAGATACARWRSWCCQPAPAGHARRREAPAGARRELRAGLRDAVIARGRRVIFVATSHPRLRRVAASSRSVLPKAHTTPRPIFGWSAIAGEIPWQSSRAARPTQPEGRLRRRVAGQPPLPVLRQGRRRRGVTPTSPACSATPPRARPATPTATSTT